MSSTLFQTRLFRPAPPALRRIAVLVVMISAATVWSSAALALDGYHDRRGLYGGLSVNAAGAFGLLDETAGGFGMGVSLGAGPSDWITVGAVLDLYWFPAEKVGKPVLFRPAVQVQMFFPSGLFFEGTAGLAWWSFRGDEGSGVRNSSDLGFSASAGAGYEFWVGASYAMTLSAAYDFTYLPDLEKPNHLITARLGFRFY